MTSTPLVLHTRVVTGSGGGPDRTILNSPRFLETSGYSSVCVFLRPPGDVGFQELERRAREWRAPLRAIDDRGALDYSILSAMSQLCEELQPDIWHAHDYKSNLLGLYLARRHRLRLITTVHGWVHRTWKTPLFYALDRWSLRRYERVLCVSEGEYRDAVASGVDAARCTIVDNGVDTERFHPPSGNEGRSDPDRSPRLRLGGIGRLEEEKGFDLLLNALRDLTRRGHDVELRLAGTGTERHRLAQQAQELGVADRVSFLGFLPRVEEFHRELDLFVLSSRREGLPNALLEAMATATPCVATPLPGVSRVMELGPGAVEVTESVTSQALVDSIEPLLRSPDRRTELGDRGHRCATESFSFAARMKKIVAIYDEMLAAAAP